MTFSVASLSARRVMAPKETTRSPAVPVTKRTVGHYLTQIARLGGYLARAKDPPPGNLVLWRGLARLTDILLGFNLDDEGCG